MGALLANATSRRELARDCKALDHWESRGPEIRPHSRAENICKIKAAKEHTHTLKSLGTNKNDPNTRTARPR